MAIVPANPKRFKRKSCNAVRAARGRVQTAGVLRVSGAGHHTPSPAPIHDVVSALSPAGAPASGEGHTAIRHQ